VRQVTPLAGKRTLLTFPIQGRFDRGLSWRRSAPNLARVLGQFFPGRSAWPAGTHWRREIVKFVTLAYFNLVHYIEQIEYSSLFDKVVFN